MIEFLSKSRRVCFNVEKIFRRKVVTVTAVLGQYVSTSGSGGDKVKVGTGMPGSNGEDGVSKLMTFHS